ncbi:MAG: gliding motility-associated transport system permease protein [Acidobacteriota bacterium]|jgi:ABC-2 type transport system permease protein|nr:gliding motility-associated transport system permease protein [Acidobacteriota bacterium]
MRAVWATYSRELRAYFFSPLAYVVLFFFLIINGVLFGAIISFLNDPRTPGGPPLAALFGGNFVFWILMPFLGPILTMRLLSEELKTGSVEVLMTAPVTEGQVVAGKYLAAFTFYLFLWFPTLAYVGIVSYWSRVDWGPVAAGYLGIAAIGALFLSIGLFASALSKNQLVAAIIAFAIEILLVLLGVLQNLVSGDTAKQVLGYLTLWEHMDELAKGIVDTRRLVFYGTTTLFFLFLTSRALEDRKWR